MNSLDSKFYFLGLLGGYIIYRVTSNNYAIENKLNLLENDINNIKERISDLELFKLKTYSNEINLSRRIWDNMSDDLEDEEIDT